MVRGDNDRHLRWLEFLRERHKSISHEEARKEEVLEIFKGLSELAKRDDVEAPHFPSWESY
jgi:hypothetical protein